MNIEKYLDRFIEERVKYKNYSTSDAKKYLCKGKNSFANQPGWQESDYLEENIRNVVIGLPRGKNTAIRVFEDFVDFLQENGVSVNVHFPPIAIDNTFERRMEIVRRLQDNKKVNDLSDYLWTSQRTIEEDINCLRGYTNEAYQVCGRKFVLSEITRKQGEVSFESTAHPLFLIQNLSQVLITLRGLKETSTNPLYKKYAEATAADIWEQLSEYARNRIRDVLIDLFGEDPSWYINLSNIDDRLFHNERECSLGYNVVLDCLKNGKKFCVEYAANGEKRYLQNCTIIGKMTDERTLTVRLPDGTEAALILDNITRSGYSLEELI